MDPNAGKKNMFNKFSKEQCISLLKKETFNRVTISFYKYIILNNLTELRDDLYKKWSRISVLGRIYISEEGINAQLSVPEHNLAEFSKNINSYTFFKDIPFKIAIEDNNLSFFKLTVKIKNQIVSDGLSSKDYDVTNVGEHLTAKQWNEAINDGAIVVDMRNHYESEIGKFKGAICPDAETFREELPLVKELLKDKKKDKVLLYCTGGIRCEKTSAYLKHHGFEDVNQLHGGIIDYIKQVNNENLENKFLGKNFVFDERRSERISNDIISKCHQCGAPSDNHVNCKNENCNLLFIQCLSCKEKNESCCSEKCISITHLPEKERMKLRKGKNNNKMYYSHSKGNLKL
tara:strand:- start:1445 stop:2482 length:1038 start_codon:yes stop_codon:yes gene_type:complete